MKKLVIAALVFALAVDATARPAAPLSKQQDKAMHKAHSLAAQAPISVVPLHGEEEFGYYVRSDGDGITFYDVDRKTEVTMLFRDVSKLKDGFGGYNSAQKKHTDHTRALVVVLIVAGLLGGVIAAAAAAKN